jgi:hypothetical protein
MLLLLTKDCLSNMLVGFVKGVHCETSFPFRQNLVA